jgi:hypothetical protein
LSTGEIGSNLVLSFNDTVSKSYQKPKNPMARFETGPMNTKTNGFRPFENKTKQKTKNLKPNKKPALSAGFFVMYTGLNF